MDVYKSENSSYTIKGEHLIKNGKENLGEKFVYVSSAVLFSVLKEHNINLGRNRTLDKKIGDEILAVLESRDMNPQKIGGRYFALIEKDGQGVYSVFCGGNIVGIEERLEEDESELRLADDNV